MKVPIRHFAHHTTQHTLSMKQLGIVASVIIVIGVITIGVRRIKRKESDES